MAKEQDEAHRITDPEFGVPYITAETIRAHPRFAEARSLYLQNLLTLYGDDPFLNKLLLEAARTVVFGGIICLVAAQDPADRTTWPTLANVKRLLEPFRMSSPRRIEQIVSRLIAVGYVVQRSAPNDARVRLLAPTMPMLRHDQDWLAAYYQPLALLYPGALYERPLARDRAFQFAQRRAAFAFNPRSAQVLVGNPDMMLFAGRDAGALILAQVVQDAQHGRNSSFDAIGRRFAVSRTHVRLLLQDAAARGLMRLHGRGGQQVDLLPPLWSMLDRFVSDGMSAHDLTAAVARRALESEARLREVG
ncbi:hypothetical protein [Flavisphingomonas formosensis]|uniref:hypothetical protein n=1 Tax=Flavisphingomonas formosensis TaxID=861534 RepID=UPI0012FAB241|nr:hypothetical protein [Sphingomonas formosensis]